jgi:hypothetical protein
MAALFFMSGFFLCMSLKASKESRNSVRGGELRIRYHWIELQSTIKAGDPSPFPIMACLGRGRTLEKTNACVVCFLELLTA